MQKPNCGSEEQVADDDERSHTTEAPPLLPWYRQVLSKTRSA